MYGEIVGYGATADAYHITQPIEDGSGAVRCVRARSNHNFLKASLRLRNRSRNTK